jgi:hypothetical protein
LSNVYVCAPETTVPAGAELEADAVVADGFPVTALLAPVVVPMAAVLAPAEVVAAAVLEPTARVVDAAAEPVTVVAEPVAVVAAPLDEVVALLAAGVLVALLPPQAARIAVTALPARPVRNVRRVRIEAFSGVRTENLLYDDMPKTVSQYICHMEKG